MSFVRQRLWIVVLLPVLLGASECSESGINADIKEVLGLDTDSPGQVAGAILLGKAFGDEGEQNAAEMGSVLKDFRRADHEQKADNAYGTHNWFEAASEYRESMQWLDDTPKNAAKKADLQMGLANSLSHQGDTARDPELGRKNYLESASLYGKLAESGERDRGLMYFNQAATLYHAGAYEAACVAYAKATPDFRDSLGKDLRDAGHPCN